MPSQWDHRADKDLLLAIIEGNNLKAIEWPVISERLNQKGYSFTKEACRQRFQKIRKESRTGSPAVSTNTTPAATQVKKRKSKSASFEDVNEDDDEETPSKIKSKRMKKENANQSTPELGDGIEL